MVDNIATKVLNSDRVLLKKNTTKESEAPQSAVPIRVISSYGSDDELVNVVRKYEPHLLRTRSFSEGDTTSPTENNIPEPKRKSKMFQFVKKTGSSLRSRLVTSKQLALGAKHGITKPCNKKKCKCCPMVMSKDSTSINNQKVKSAPGNCKSYNIVYLVQCDLCKKGYVGRTINCLHERMNGHRSKYYDLIAGKHVDITSDDYSLGLHLVDHGLFEHSDFNDTFRTFILENCSPYQLEEKENKYIHLLRTLRPLGLNTINPYGLTLFHNPNSI